jgi:hypothetical protein
MAKWDHVTAEQIEKERDEYGNSWRQVGINLEIGSPTTARNAYEALTGRSHSEKTATATVRNSAEIGTSKSSTSKTVQANWDDDSDQDEIIEKCANARLVIHRGLKVDEDGKAVAEIIKTGKVAGMAYDGGGFGDLVINVTERGTGGRRTFRVKEITQVQ